MDTEKKPSPREETDQQPVYYYSRSRRLERASPAVRALNEEGPGKRPSVMGSLIGTKPQAIVFITILIFTGVGLALSLFSGGDRITIGGNTLSFSAMGFEGTTLLAIKKTCRDDGRAYTGAVDMAVSPVLRAGENQDVPVWSQRIFFSLKPEEDFRFAVPLEAAELLILLQTETARTTLKVKPK